MKLLLTILLIAFVVLFLVNMILGRIWGFYQPLKWTSGGETTFVSELAILVFISSCLLGVIWDSEISAVCVIFALPAAMISYISEGRARKRFLLKEAELYEANKKEHPGIFDTLPPERLDDFDDEVFDLYDAGIATYLGTISREDLKILIDRFELDGEQGPNDIFVFHEMVELAKEAGISDELESLLFQALEKRDYLYLRWIPRLSRLN
ncbi:hypothetical protein Pan153_51250 [Gimesia panareensis]|uniref:Uncharacterized protein n=1 Tax=Gimesia panareensis TaxID=2527978 RepID=A0A518FVX9_9PLAN|nr:hypothetical protein [Gimesia panareensis]QDV20450.1 hypothetical protein Pan153_51250 [Gimesia panareensis]